MPFKRNTVWKNANSNTNPLLHLVIDVSPHEEIKGSDYVTTWSAPFEKPSEKVAGYSWYGPVEEFLKNFVAVTK